MLAAVGAANLAAAALFAATAMRLALREAEGHARLALNAIALWWGTMAMLEVVQGVETLAAVAGTLAAQALQADRYVNGLLVGIGCWGLAFHVAYLRFGDPRWGWWLSPVYAVVMGLHWAATATHPVTAFVLEAHQVRLVYDPPLFPSLVATLVVLGVGGTMIVAPTVYLALRRHLLEPEQRRRALLVSAGVLLWGGIPFIAYMTQNPWADFLTVNGMTAVAAVLAWLAYFPPGKSRARPRPFVEFARPLPADERLYES
jgi:hypothetical protein